MNFQNFEIQPQQRKPHTVLFCRADGKFQTITVWGFKILKALTFSLTICGNEQQRRLGVNGASLLLAVQLEKPHIV